GRDPIAQRDDVADRHRDLVGRVAHERADPPTAAHHAGHRELAQYLPYGGPADLEPLGQLPFVGQLVAGGEPATEPVPQPARRGLQRGFAPSHGSPLRNGRYQTCSSTRMVLPPITFAISASE